MRVLIRAVDLLIVLAAIFATACSRPSAAGSPEIRLVHATDSTPAHIEVTGLSGTDRASVARQSMTTEQWQQVLAVTVKSSQEAGVPVPIAGQYIVDRDALRFTPLYPFDPGREYEVLFGSTKTTVALPARPPASATYVTQVYPSGDLLPENQLRIYIHFSAPMGRRGGIDHVRLLDDRGQEVEMPFLPLDAEFWNSDRTRYTLFFDPGRQKRGILPNREMGPSLVAGRTYTLIVDRGWIDGNGEALRESYSKRFRVGPPVLSALDPGGWAVDPPNAGTRDPVSVTFRVPLDHALLLNAIYVSRDGRAVTGDVRVDVHETRWMMTPREPWSAGAYALTVLSTLEDTAGNRIGRPFEVSEFVRPMEPVPDSIATRLPFTISASSQTLPSTR
jgi:hypothetical protein